METAAAAAAAKSADQDLPIKIYRSRSADQDLPISKADFQKRYKNKYIKNYI